MAVVARDVVRPIAFGQFCAGKPGWMKPFLRVEWGMRWAAFVLAQWAFLEILEYIGSFSILAAVVLYFAGTHDRVVQKHYQAWQVINTAQGKGGAGGRIDAMQDLNDDGVSLVGVDVRDAFLERVQLKNAELRWAALSSADMMDSNLAGANLELANLDTTNLRNARLAGTRFINANLQDADLSGADLAGANLHGADLSRASLTGIMNWRSITDIAEADISGVEDPPEGFVEWAKQKGAVQRPAARPATRAIIVPRVPN